MISRALFCFVVLLVGNTALAQVVLPPVITKSFGAANIPLNGTTTLTFTLTNPNATTDLIGPFVGDTFPEGLVVAAPGGWSGTCPGIHSANSGSNRVQMAMATGSGAPFHFGPAAQCTFTVNVTGTTVGAKINVSDAVTAVNSGPGNTATATITVLPAATAVLDPSYGTDGIVVAQASGAVDAIAVQPDGKLMVSDYFITGYFVRNIYAYAQALVRLETDGAVDQSFAGGGVLKGGSFVGATSTRLLLIQRDHSIVRLEWNGLLARYLPDGSNDQAFGDAAANAFAVVESEINSAFVLSVLTLSPDDKIVLAGTLCDWRTERSQRVCRALTLRLNPDGTLDRTLGGAGYVMLPTGQYDYPRRLAVQPDGKLVISVSQGQEGSGALLRLNVDGTPDESFGDAGRSEYLPGLIGSLVRQPDGGLVLVLLSPSEKDGWTLSMRRVAADGTLDLSFGTNGVVQLTDDGGSPTNLVVLPDGTVFVRFEAPLSGRSTLPTNWLYRYSQDGTLDERFGDGGAIRLPYGLQIPALGTDGVLYMAGYIGSAPAVARYIGVNAP